MNRAAHSPRRKTGHRTARANARISDDERRSGICDGRVAQDGKAPRRAHRRSRLRPCAAQTARRKQQDSRYPIRKRTFAANHGASFPFDSRIPRSRPKPGSTWDGTNIATPARSKWIFTKKVSAMLESDKPKFGIEPRGIILRASVRGYIP